MIGIIFWFIDYMFYSLICASLLLVVFMYLPVLLISGYLYNFIKGNKFMYKYLNECLLYTLGYIGLFMICYFYYFNVINPEYITFGKLRFSMDGVSGFENFIYFIHRLFVMGVVIWGFAKWLSKDYYLESMFEC